MLITILNRSIGNKNKVFFNSLNLNWQTCASNGRSKKKVKSRWCNIVRHWFYVLLHHRKLIFFRDTKKKTMARFLAANIDDFETIHFSLQMRRCKKKGEKKNATLSDIYVSVILHHLHHRNTKTYFSVMPFKLTKVLLFSFFLHHRCHSKNANSKT